MFSRRQFLARSFRSAGLLGATSLLPAWALPATLGNVGLASSPGNHFDLRVARFPVRINGVDGHAVGVNETLPAPLLRFRKGEEVTVNVTNALQEDTSIHWHGLLVPFHMDGVPGVSFPGISPGETFQYRFSVPQSGTYWYHSHSGLQEQLGHYGPLIIDPASRDPVDYDREYVLVLSDWSFENPHRIFNKLKSMGEMYNFNKRTLPDLLEDVREQGLKTTVESRAMWAGMRMNPRDIADVTGATYQYLINGHTTEDNWNAVFAPGERLRLRIINASAMTLFNVRIPGLPMTVVQADGLNVQPIEVDEFQIGVAETYDVIVTPGEPGAFAFVAESIDRYGQVVATLGSGVGLRATVPALRSVPTLGMKDMAMEHTAQHGMHHAAHGAAASAHEEHSDRKYTAAKGKSLDQGTSNHDSVDHGAMGHGTTHSPVAREQTLHHSETAHRMPSERDFAGPQLVRGPGVASIAKQPSSRLDEPGTGLEELPHRVLRYSQLRSLEANPDPRPPGREIEINLTGNMERYMWSFDGVKFSEITAPITFHEGERLRMNLVNNTMMNHPIHLHGMFFELVNGGGSHKPRKHTVIVKPGERLAVDITADNVGDWAFHCHLLYHMHAGMMQVVSVLPRTHNHQHPPHGDLHADAGRGLPHRFEALGFEDE